MPSNRMIRRNEEREAIVVTSTFVDDCLANRLKHLVQSSSSPNRDIWILHSHHVFDPRFNSAEYSKYYDSPDKLLVQDRDIHSDSALLQRSREHISSIPGLHSANQSPVLFHLFDDKISGSSKSSFLKFITQHGYKSAWLIEDDAFFTGDWGLFFDKMDEIDADVLTTIKKKRSRSSWSVGRRKSCKINYDQEMQKCNKLSLNKLGWFIIRLNQQVASSLIRDLDAKTIQGFHEDVLGAHSVAHGFTTQQVPSELIGYAKVGHYKEDQGLPESQTSKLENFSPVSNKLYHPVKCKVYPPGGFDEILIRWTKWRPFKDGFIQIARKFKRHKLNYWDR